MSDLVVDLDNAAGGTALTTMNADVSEGSFPLPATAIATIGANAAPQLNSASVKVYLAVLELGFIIFLALMIAWRYSDMNLTMALRGPEISPLVGSGAYAYEIYQRTGTIPLWNPFMGHGGEPMLEAPLSYILNPFMFLPLFTNGLTNGLKVTILLHVMLMGIGGWALALVLGMKQFGRILLGLMLIGLGGYAIAIGDGWYQIALSISYLPWLLASLIGLLYRRGRWATGLFVVSSFLFLTSGSFWYTLPMALLCLPLVLTGVVQRNGRQWVLLGRPLRRLSIAILLALLVGAIRILPQIRVATNFFHNNTGLLPENSLLNVLTSFVLPTFDPVTAWTYYMYAASIPLIVVVFLLWLLIVPKIKMPHPVLLRIVLSLSVGTIPLLIWALEGTPFMIKLYELFPVLYNWRWTTRALVPVAVWLVTLLALLMDSIFQRLREAATTQQPLGIGLPFSQFQFNLPRTVSKSLALLLLVGSFVFMFNDAYSTATYNWDQFTGLEDHSWLRDWQGVNFLRQTYPTQFLMVDTQNRMVGNDFFETLTRTVIGNPEIATIGSPSTIGTDCINGTKTQFAAGHVWEFLESRPLDGYEAVPNAPIAVAWSSAWSHPDALDYAFVVNSKMLDRTPDDPKLHRYQTRPVTYFHHLQTVQVEVSSYYPHDVVVIQEAAYPGWQVTINGLPANVESVDGYLGVRLPDDGQPVTIEFVYRPTLLYVGAGISLLGLILLTAMIFRLDQRLGIDKPLQAAADKLWLGVILPILNKIYRGLNQWIDLDKESAG
ncbi:MAG: hypothetical protein KF726_21600 [Anaerolineae bacterium]|nr:hypothetical protein [Anaerolineae bacterium]